MLVRWLEIVMSTVVECLAKTAFITVLRPPTTTAITTSYCWRPPRPSGTRLPPNKPVNRHFHHPIKIHVNVYRFCQNNNKFDKFISVSVYAKNKLKKVPRVYNEKQYVDDSLNTTTQFSP